MSSSVWFIVTVIAAVLIIFFNALKRRLSIEIHLRHVPGPPSTNSLLGNISLLFDTPENAFKVVRKWGRDYYPIYGNWIAHLSVANIVNPYDFETILSNMVHNSKGPLYDMLHSWLGTGLLTSGGLKWQTRRKILTPSFHFNILQEFIKVFNEETANLVTRLKKDCHKPYIEVTDYISGFALNTIGETAMGTNFVDSSSGREYKNAIYDIGQVYVHRMCRPWLLNKILYFFDRRYFYEKNLVKKLHQFTNEVIAKREDNFQPIKLDTTDDFSYSKKKRLAMLDLLLTAKNQDGSIDDDGVREEVDTFMFEGHDTTSVAISYALMLLACHRDVQDRIVEEVQQVFHDDSKPDYKTLHDLKYTEMCIKEVLRLYPSVPFISRVLGEDITTYSGHLLKAGSSIHLHIYDLHRNPEIYPEPERFDPERFLPENCQKRHNFAYLPFSAGPRNCIGQKFAMLEIKTVLCGILSEFILEPVDTPETMVPILDVVLRNKNSIRVRFVPRAGNK